MAKIKGTYFVNTVKALRLNRQAAEREVPAGLRSYLEKPILTSGWYPEQEHLELLGALTRCMSLGKGDPWENLGRIAAERDMIGTYQALLKSGDPGTSFKRLVQVWTLGHDSGDMEVTLPGPGKGQLDLRKFPILSAELCRVHGSFFATVVRLAGATDVDLKHTLCRAKGDDFCRWEATWHEPG